MNREFMAAQKYLDLLREQRMEILEHLGIPKLFFKKKKKAKGKK